MFKMKKYRYIFVLLCAVLWACSDGELEGDLYPVAVDKGGQDGGGSKGDNSMDAVVKGIKENMVWLYGSSFTMGATPVQQDEALTNEYPAHQVTVRDFRLCRYEMTQREWNAIAAWGGYRKVDFSVKGDNLPVTDVTYDMCLDIIDILNRYTGLKFRLPTEEEWEYAARMGTYGSDYKYAGGDRLYKLGWYADNSYGMPHPVGEKEPNIKDFYDMSGNVAEWCSSYYTEDYRQGSTIHRDKRVVRGGSYDLEAKYCRVSTRIPIPASEATYDLGLRLAIDKLYDLQLDSHYEEFGKEGGVREIKVTTNGEMLRCHCYAPWCKVVKSGDKLIISLEENKGVQRETVISVLAGDEEWEGEADIRIMQEGKPMEIGALYERDGVKGVVYEISSNGRSGKIVSLSEESYTWSSLSDYNTYATSTDGEANMQIILNTGYGINNWPAFEWCYYYSYDHKWYLPAVNELADMFAAIRNYGTSKFDRILSENGGQEFSSASDYWSSTEVDYEWAYTVNKSGTVYGLHKDNNYRVRAIRKVTFD